MDDSTNSSEQEFLAVSSSNGSVHNQDNGFLQKRVEELETIVKSQQAQIDELKSLVERIGTLPIVEGNGTMASNHKERKIAPPIQYKYTQSSYAKNESKHKSIYTRSLTSPLRRPPSSGKNNLQSRGSNNSLLSESPSRDSSSPRASPLPRTANLSGTPLAKRWNSSTTIDSASPIASSGSGGAAFGQSRFSNKSLVNLSLNKSRQNLHSVSCAQLNEDENCLKLLFKGIPLVFPIPKALPEFDLNQQPEMPYHKLILDWVYGYRGKDCRQNLYYLPTGEIVYFTAAVAVLHNVDFSLQRHYLEHTSEIKSMALHPNKLLIATGQSGSMEKNAMPHIRIWNSVSLTTTAVIGVGHFTGPINCLAFSRTENGSLLVAIEDYTEKIMTVWNWQSGGESGVKVTETKCSVDPIVACEFNPLDKTQIITAGKTHIAFWTFDNTGAYKKMGIFDTRDKPKYVTCISFTQSGDIVTGDTNGNIAIFGRGTNTIIRLLRKIHDGPVFTLCALRNSGFISGGGKDGKLVLFQDNLSSSNAVCTIEPHFGGVRVVTQGRGAVLFIGTTRNCILMGQLEDTEFTPLVMGHVGEVNALSCGSKLGQFITGGYDRLLQCWDSLTHTVVWSKDIEEPIQCCAVSPADNKTIIVGGGSGRWSVYNGETRELLGQYFDGSDVITTVKFSPSGQYVAIGSRDSGIYIYEIGKQNSKKLSKVGRCAGHTGSVLAIDWTVDDMHMRSNSTSIEVLHWSPHLCRQVTNASSISELQWATQSCILTFETLGIWPENAEDYDVVSAAKSDDSSTLVAGNSNGLIQVYNYPAALPNSLFDTYRGHGGDVSSVIFSQDNQLLSVGRSDASVLQWRVI